MITIERAKPKYHGLHISRECYLDLSDDGYKYDMINGVLEMTPSPFFEHNQATGKFFKLLDLFLDSHPLGKAVPEIDVFLPDGGDVLRPDISFILVENFDIIAGHIHGTPDLICEVLSDSTALRDLEVKAERYLLNGVQEYWIIDPRKDAIKLLQVWLSEKNHWKKLSSEQLESRLLKGFSISVEDVLEYSR